jgi:hypothetical protein
MEAEWSWYAGTPTSPKVLEQRLFVRIHRILAELPHSTKLEPRNLIGPWMIPTEIPQSSHEEGSRQDGRPSGPQSLSTLLIRPHLPSTLRMRALQVESPKCGVSPHFHRRGVFIGTWGSSTDLEMSVWHQVVFGWLGGAASTDFLHRLGLLLLVDTFPRSRGSNWHKTWPADLGVWPASRPFVPFSLGFDTLSPCVKYTPMVMMTLAFGQLYFVIPWNAPI